MPSHLAPSAARSEAPKSQARKSSPEQRTFVHDGPDGAPPRSGGGVITHEPALRMNFAYVLLQPCQNVPKSHQQETRGLQTFLHTTHMHGKADAEKSVPAKPMAHDRATCEESRSPPRSGGGDPPCTCTEEPDSVRNAALPSPISPKNSFKAVRADRRKKPA